jgi:hypothetical protein
VKKSIQSRNAAQLPESLNRHLGQYALAASAAGVGLLAVAQPAEAKIVYTPAHKVTGHNLPGINLDLNHDGVADFRLCRNDDTYHCTATTGAHPLGFYSRLLARPINKLNGVVGKGTYASALVAGKPIGGHGTFPNGDSVMAWGWESGSLSHSGGPWLNVTNRYLGFKFVIKGKIHYGWARLNVRWWQGPQKATLTGYAYETIPGKPIITGKTKGPDVITLEPGSLGRLAQGSAGR